MSDLLHLSDTKINKGHFVEPSYDENDIHISKTNEKENSRAEFQDCNLKCSRKSKESPNYK